MVNIFEENIKNSLKLFCNHHPGMMVWYKSNDNLKPQTQKDRLLICPCPGDFFCAFNHVPFLIECKSTDKLEGYPLSQIKTKQIDLMSMWERQGTKCFYILKDVRKNIVVVLTLSEMKAIKLKSSEVTVEMLATIPEAMRLNQIEGSLYDLRPIFYTVDSIQKTVEENVVDSLTVKIWELQMLLKLKEKEIEKLKHNTSQQCLAESTNIDKLGKLIDDYQRRQQ